MIVCSFSSPKYLQKLLPWERYATMPKNGGMLEE